MTNMQTLPIPKWLSDHCDRLQDEESQIQNLNLNIRRLNSGMIKALSDALMKNSDIESINLTSALLQDQEQNLLPFMKVLQKHSSLRAIHLSYNRMRHFHGIEQSLRDNTHLRELYLDYNRLHCDTAIELANALKENTTLAVLQLNSNSIGDVGGKAIADALQNNNTLKLLGMGQNQLGKKTADAMRSSLKVNTTLTTLQIDRNPDMEGDIGGLTQIVQCNRAGRYLLRKQNDIPHALWPSLFQKLDFNMMFFFLSEQPQLLMG